MRLLAAALLLTATLPLFATPTDFSFRDVEVQNICQTIAVLGKFNVIVDPGLARDKLTFSVRQVEPLDALHDIARQVGGQVIRIRHEEGTLTATFMVARPEEVQKQGRVTRTIQLKYAQALAVVRAAGERLEAVLGSKAAVDERTNRLMLTGTEDAVSRATDLLKDLDLPVPSADIDLTVSAGETGRGQPVWHGAATTSQGKVAKLVIGSTAALKAPGWKLLGLEAKVQFRCNPDNVLGVGLNVNAQLEKNGIKHAVQWSTEVQARTGEEVFVGTVEVGPNEAISLHVKPTVQTGTMSPPACEGGHPVPSPSSSGDLDLEGI